MSVFIPLGSSGTAGRAEVVGTGTSPTVTEPTAAKNGDVLFAFALAAVAGAITRPAGWSPLYLAAASASGWDVSWIRRGETAPNLTWGLTGSVYREVYVVCLQRNGAGPITLHAQSASGAVTDASTANPNPPPLTTTAPTALALCCGQQFGVSATTWACAGYTVQTSNGSSFDGGLFSKALSVAGIEDPPQWTGTAPPSSNLWDGATIAFTDEPLLTAGYGSSPPVIPKSVPRQQRLDDWP